MQSLDMQERQIVSAVNHYITVTSDKLAEDLALEPISNNSKLTLVTVGNRCDQATHAVVTESNVAQAHISKGMSNQLIKQYTSEVVAKKTQSYDAKIIKLEINTLYNDLKNIEDLFNKLQVNVAEVDLNSLLKEINRIEAILHTDKNIILECKQLHLKVNNLLATLGDNTNTINADEIIDHINKTSIDLELIKTNIPNNQQMLIENKDRLKNAIELLTILQNNLQIVEMHTNDTTHKEKLSSINNCVTYCIKSADKLEEIKEAVTCAIYAELIREKQVLKDLKSNHVFLQRELNSASEEKNSLLAELRQSLAGPVLEEEASEKERLDKINTAIAAAEGEITLINQAINLETKIANSSATLSSNQQGQSLNIDNELFNLLDIGLTVQINFMFKHQELNKLITINTAKVDNLQQALATLKGEQYITAVKFKAQIKQKLSELKTQKQTNLDNYDQKRSEVWHQLNQAIGYSVLDELCRKNSFAAAKEQITVIEKKLEVLQNYLAICGYSSTGKYITFANSYIGWLNEQCKEAAIRINLAGKIDRTKFTQVEEYAIANAKLGDGASTYYHSCEKTSPIVYVNTMQNALNNAAITAQQEYKLMRLEHIALLRLEEQKLNAHFNNLVVTAINDEIELSTEIFSKLQAEYLDVTQQQTLIGLYNSWSKINVAAEEICSKSLAKVNNDHLKLKNKG